MKYILWELIALILRPFVTKIPRGHIVIGSKSGDFTDNSKFLYLTLLSSGYQIYWACHTGEQLRSMQRNGYDKVFNAYSLSSIKIISGASHYIVCFDMYDINPYFLHPRTKVIHLWHGVSLKRFGKSNRFSYLYNPSGLKQLAQSWIFRRKMHVPDIFINPCPKLNDSLSHAFDLPPRNILNVQYPRTSYLRRSCSPSLERRRVLWLPTLRNYWPSLIQSDYLIVKRELAKRGIELDIRYHPAQKGLGTGYDVYTEASQYSAIVTDLSSVAIELNVVGFPVFVYFPDEDQYLRQERELLKESSAFRIDQIDNPLQLCDRIENNQPNFNEILFECTDVDADWSTILTCDVEKRAELG